MYIFILYKYNIHRKGDTIPHIFVCIFVYKLYFILNFKIMTD